MSKRRKFSDEFKREAVGLTRQPGVSVSQVARDLGVGAGLLGRWRRELAIEAGVPPYVIFHDAVLRAMANERPATRSALGAIPGVGAKKLEAWGDAFLSVIRQF